jgi:hemerythrin-like domain-containing protein
MRDTAVALIQYEHETLSAVVQALQKHIRDLQAGWAEADFALLAAMLYYIDIFPESCHHPKEEEYLFKPVLARTSAANSIIEELRAEHESSGRMMANLAQTLVHYQGGRADGLETFTHAVDAYARLLASHMHKEEFELIPIACECLTPADWDAASAAFASNYDPMFGDRPAREFRRLRQRIVALAPRKLKMQRPRSDVR